MTAIEVHPSETYDPDNKADVQEVFSADEQIQKWTIYDVREAQERQLCSKWPSDVCTSSLTINQQQINHQFFYFKIGNFETDMGGLLWLAFLSSVLMQTIALLLITPISDQEQYKMPMFRWLAIILLISMLSGIILAVSSSFWYVLLLQVAFMALFFNMVNVIQDSILPELVQTNEQILMIEKEKGKDSEMYKSQAKSMINLSFGTAFTRGQFSSCLFLFIQIIFELFLKQDDLRDPRNNQIQVYLNIIASFIFIQGLQEVVWKIKAVKGRNWVSWTSYFKSDNVGFNFLCKVCSFTDLSRVLMAWFFLSDIDNAVLFMVNIWGTFDIKVSQQMPILVVSQMVLPVGTWFSTQIREKQKLSYLQILKCIIVANLVVCTICQIIFLDQMILASWGMGISQALSIGSLQTLFKSSVGYITPACYEASVFSLMQITSKGTSWVTPVILIQLEMLSAMQNDKTIKVRGALWYIILQIISLTLMFMIDLDRGYQKRLDFEEEITTLKEHNIEHSNNIDECDNQE